MDRNPFQAVDLGLISHIDDLKLTAASQTKPNLLMKYLPSYFIS